MTAKTGASTRIISKRGTTFGTAVAGGAGDKLEVESLEWGENAEALRDNPIGSGLDMDNASTRGATAPSVTITKKARYNDGGTGIETLLWGGESVMNMGSGLYSHSILYNATRNRAFHTLAWDGAAGSTIEMASCTPFRLTERVDNPPNYLMQTIELLGNTVSYASSTNTASTLNSATVADTTRIIVKPSDKFRLNLFSASALANGDTVSIKSFERVFEFPVEFAREIKNSAGNGQPIATGDAPLSSTLTITMRNLDDAQFRMLINSQNDTQYKADLTVSDATTGMSKVFYWPLLQQVEDPQWDLTGPNDNEVTITFKCLVSTTNPSGMIHGYPYSIITNNRSTANET